jgi:hypothetical protein
MIETVMVRLGRGHLYRRLLVRGLAGCLGSPGGKTSALFCTAPILAGAIGESHGPLE